MTQTISAQAMADQAKLQKAHREAEARERYQQLVRRHAAGDAPKADNVQTILEAAGKSWDDYTADVEKRTDVIAKQAKLGGLAALIKRQRELRVEIPRRETEFESAATAHRAWMESAKGELASTAGRINELHQVENELVRDCQDEKLKAEFKEARARFDHLSSKARGLQASAADVRRTRQSAFYKVHDQEHSAGHGPRSAERRAKAEDDRKALAAADAELKAAEAAAAAAEADLAQAELAIEKIRALMIKA